MEYVPTVGQRLHGPLSFVRLLVGFLVGSVRLRLAVGSLMGSTVGSLMGSTVGSMVGSLMGAASTAGGGSVMGAASTAGGCHIGGASIASLRDEQPIRNCSSMRARRETCAGWVVMGENDKAELNFEV